MTTTTGLPTSQFQPRMQINQINNYTCSPIESSTPIHLVPKARRGRRPTVPPEFREQIRRLKKQNMERRRRACISDKMNALHDLAMQLIGIDPLQQNKVEKTDILGVCYTIFDGIAKIVQEKPELRYRLQKLTPNIHKPNSQETSSTPSIPASKSSHPCKSNKLNPNFIDNLELRNNNPDSSRPNQLPGDSRLNNSSYEVHSNQINTNLYKHNSFRMPLKYRLSPKSHNNKSNSWIGQFQESGNRQSYPAGGGLTSPVFWTHKIPETNQKWSQSNLSKDVVWRPYLD